MTQRRMLRKNLFCTKTQSLTQKLAAQPRDDEKRGAKCDNLAPLFSTSRGWAAGF